MCIFVNNRVLVGLLAIVGVTFSNAQNATCPGICPEGEEMLNAATDVSIDGTLATCGFFDSKAKDETDEEVCTANAEKAESAGCKCGTPIECPGICPEGEEMLNAATDVNIDGTIATCGFFDNRAKDVIDEEVCTANAEKAESAGCKCGTPTECPGICAEGETLVNANEDYDVCNTRASCGFFDAENKKEIDEEVCTQNAMNARLAGCNCTGEYPDDNVIDCSATTSTGKQTQAILSAVLVGAVMTWATTM